MDKSATELPSLSADGGICSKCRIFPAAQSDASDRQLRFAWCPVATHDEDHDFYVAPRHIVVLVVSATLCRTCSHILGYYSMIPTNIQIIIIMASLHDRSGRLLIIGRTMMYKWGHPVVTLLATNGPIRRNVHRMKLEG
eukprot:2437846-Pleurochrysis_carterae.AAC.3